jgi:heat shock protein HtpX
MCVDNPRGGFGELFDTHPSVENRVAALVKYAGGHDSGPLALSDEETENDLSEPAAAPVDGPWGRPEDSDEGGPAPKQGAGAPETPSGPWGPHST